MNQEPKETTISKAYMDRVKELQDEHRDRYNASLAETQRLLDLGKDLEWLKKANALMRGRK